MRDRVRSPEDAREGPRNRRCPRSRDRPRGGTRNRRMRSTVELRYSSSVAAASRSAVTPLLSWRTGHKRRSYSSGGVCVFLKVPRRGQRRRSGAGPLVPGPRPRDHRSKFCRRSVDRLHQRRPCRRHSAASALPRTLGLLRRRHLVAILRRRRTRRGPRLPLRMEGKTGFHGEEVRLAAAISTPPTEDERRDALVERLFMATVGAMDVLGVYIGDRLGLYRALTERGPLHVAGAGWGAGSERALRPRVAGAAGRQWHPGARHRPGERRAAALLAAGRPRRGAARRDRPDCIAPIGQLLVACVRPLDAVLEAFRTGDGVPYAAYGADLHEGQARVTRPLFDHLLASEWLPAVPQVHERLQADPPAPRPPHAPTRAELRRCDRRARRIDDLNLPGALC
jgi:hypothetical protein